MKQKYNSRDFEYTEFLLAIAEGISMNLSVSQNNYNQKMSFTSFSTQIISKLAESSPYEKKVAMKAFGLSEKMYTTVKKSPLELRIENEHFHIGNYNTGYGGLEDDDVFVGIRKAYSALKTYIEPATKIITEKEGKITAKMQKLEAEIAELRTKSSSFDADSKKAVNFAYQTEYKTNDLNVLDDVLTEYKKVPGENSPHYWEGISAREYKSNLKQGYKEVDKKYRTEFSKYKTSAWRQNLDDKIDSFNNWFKHNFRPYDD